MDGNTGRDRSLDRTEIWREIENETGGRGDISVCNMRTIHVASLFSLLLFLSNLVSLSNSPILSLHSFHSVSLSLLLVSLLIVLSSLYMKRNYRCKASLLLPCFYIPLQHTCKEIHLGCPLPSATIVIFTSQRWDEM